MTKCLAVTILVLLGTLNAFAQMGGEHTYNFLNLGSSARVAALGGEQVALGDADVSQVFYNPSALSPVMDQTMALNYVSYLADIHYGYASYARSFKKWGTWSAGIHYVNYGKFTEANSLGEITGNFKASEYAFLISWSKKVHKLFRVAATFKPVYSVLERYKSFGLAADIGLTYQSTGKLFTAALVARNLGFQVKPYYGSHRENLPFELLVGFSKKLAHAPFRLALTYKHLQKFDLSASPTSSENSFTDNSFNDETDLKNSFTDKALKHFVFGLEFIPTKNFVLRAGYNFQRRQELKIDAKRSTVGFSFGFGVNVSRFHISYALARYHLAGTSNHFSVNMRLNDFNFN